MIRTRIRDTRHTLQGKKEIAMGNRFSGVIVTVAIAAAASAAISVSVTRASAQAPAVSGLALNTPPLKTTWGEPDLQGIWTDEFDTPLQRPAKYADQEFFTAAQRAELDAARSAILPGSRTSARSMKPTMLRRSLPRSALGRARPRSLILSMAGFRR
jgi:hypothetical protein